MIPKLFLEWYTKIHRGKHKISRRILELELYGDNLPGDLYIDHKEEWFVVKKEKETIYYNIYHNNHSSNVGMACLVVEWDGFFDQMVTYHSKDHGSFIGTCSCYDFLYHYWCWTTGKDIDIANNRSYSSWDIIRIFWIYVYYLEVVEKTDGLIGLLDRHSYKEAFRHQNEEAAVVMQDLTRRKLS